MTNYVYVSVNKHDNKLFQIFWTMSELSTGIKLYNELGLTCFKYYQIFSPSKDTSGPYTEKYIEHMINTKQVKEIA